MSPSIALLGLLAARGSGGADAGRTHVPVPELEGEQLPDLLGHVPATAALVCHQLQQRLTLDEPGGHELAVDEDVVDQLAQVVGDPGSEGCAEGCLGAIDDRLRDPSARSVLQRRLLYATADLLRSRQ